MLTVSDRPFSPTKSRRFLLSVERERAFSNGPDSNGTANPVPTVEIARTEQVADSFDSLLGDHRSLRAGATQRRKGNKLEEYSYCRSLLLEIIDRIACTQSVPTVMAAKMDWDLTECNRDSNRQNTNRSSYSSSSHTLILRLVHTGFH